MRFSRALVVFCAAVLSAVSGLSQVSAPRSLQTGRALISTPFAPIDTPTLSFFQGFSHDPSARWRLSGFPLFDALFKASDQRHALDETARLLLRPLKEVAMEDAWFYEQVMGETPDLTLKFRTEASSLQGDFIQFLRKNYPKIETRARALIERNIGELQDRIEHQADGISFQRYSAILQFAYRARELYGPNLEEPVSRLRSLALINFEASLPEGSLFSRAVARVHEAVSPERMKVADAYRHEGLRGWRLDNGEKLVFTEEGRLYSARPEVFTELSVREDIERKGLRQIRFEDPSGQRFELFMAADPLNPFAENRPGGWSTEGKKPPVDLSRPIVAPFTSSTLKKVFKADFNEDVDMRELQPGEAAQRSEAASVRGAAVIWGLIAGALAMLLSSLNGWAFWIPVLTFAVPVLPFLMGSWGTEEGRPGKAGLLFLLATVFSFEVLFLLGSPKLSSASLGTTEALFLIPLAFSLLFGFKSAITHPDPYAKWRKKR